MADEISNPPIDCLWGAPYQDWQGVWRCPSSTTNPPIIYPVGGAAPSNPPFGRRQGQAITNNYYFAPAAPLSQYPSVALPTTPPANNSSGKIFGLSPGIALAVGAGLLFALSSMDTGKK